ncbi:hypothetical protein [Photobacterium damselae]|uniref:hypothetical protein n=1 Tax=Photobacterium damselae TaxID=38293 RepID=UPI001F3B5D5C|nr:hypothetical protein [Photobacterium damselae]UKA04722.1 hypothetical protein IHC89_21005 [Photobacterium damselae subsp. damselae]
MSDFELGIFYAAALLVTLHDEPTLAVDILNEAGLLSSDISELDATEMEAMIKLSKADSRCEFTGI